MSKPVISLIGRPNVGKSTLFNRMSKTRDALVADFPGLTRDRKYANAKIGKYSYLLVDTGGVELFIDTGIMSHMAKQTLLAIEESDIVVFIVDGKSGITPQDKVIANKLRVLNKKVYVAINKVEGIEKNIAISDFYELGFDNLYPISASHGTGIFKLFNEILETLPIYKEEEMDNGITFAVVGRPNVGKSTLVNSMLGEDRVIVFDEAGTTRDSINISFQKFGKNYTIIDTAGIRRKGKVEDKIEKFSVLKSIQSINDSNVVLLVLDAHLDIAEQDATIVGYALDAGKAIVVIINKWDHINEDQRSEIKENIKRKLNFLDFAHFNFISALYNKGINEIFKSINLSYEAAFVKLSTPKITRVLLEAIKRQPPAYKGQFRPKLRYAHQGGVNPPIIIVHGNSLDHIAKSYTKYLERSFRQAFNLKGTPLRIEYKITTNPFSEK